MHFEYESGENSEVEEMLSQVLGQARLGNDKIIQLIVRG